MANGNDCALWDLIQKAEERRCEKELKRSFKLAEEVTMIFLFLKDSGLDFDYSVKDYLAEYYQKEPEVLKRALEFYEKIKESKVSKALGSVQIVPKIEDGKRSIWVHFVWKDSKILVKNGDGQK